MSDISEIRARINSVAETKKVTDAMYMISSVKMRRAMREVTNTEPYFSSLSEEIGRIFRIIPDISNRYFKVPDPMTGGHIKHGVLLVTSDKGLAGEYNENVISLCEDVLSRHSETVLFVIGELGRQHFSSKGVPTVPEFRYSAELPNVWKARRICSDLLEYFDTGRADEISIIYTDYLSGRPGEAKRSILLPLKRSLFASVTEDDSIETERDRNVFFPDPDTVLSGIIPSYITGYIYSILVDSYCSEQQARMTAMNSASSNAENILNELRLKYNRIRQAEITREISEVTSGARALKKKKETRDGKQN